MTQGLTPAGFVVFIHRPGRMPHMEFIAADNLGEAVRQGSRLFADYRGAAYFEIWGEDLLLFTSMAPEEAL